MQSEAMLTNTRARRAHSRGMHGWNLAGKIAIDPGKYVAYSPRDSLQKMTSLHEPLHISRILAS